MISIDLQSQIFEKKNWSTKQAKIVPEIRFVVIISSLVH